MPTMHRVTALVDWDTARRIAPIRDQSIRSLEQVIERLQIAISRFVNTRDKKGGYRVNWRIYHGWHQGKTKTKDRLLFEQYVRTAKGRTICNVSFGTDYEFSGSLCCNSRRTPIYDSLRLDATTRETRQKMVDTMLVCDLLHLARTKDASLYIVIANDDDLIPALYTAEAWSASVMLLHNREHTNSHLKLDGIAERMSFQ